MSNVNTEETMQRPKALFEEDYVVAQPRLGIVGSALTWQELFQKGTVDLGEITLLAVEGADPVFKEIVVASVKSSFFKDKGITFEELKAAAKGRSEAFMVHGATHYELGTYLHNPNGAAVSVICEIKDAAGKSDGKGIRVVHDEFWVNGQRILGEEAAIMANRAAHKEEVKNFINS